MTSSATIHEVPDTLYVGQEGATRLESPLLPEERLALLAGLTVEPAPDGSVVLRVGAAESQIEGLTLAEVEHVLAAIDGQATVAAIRRRLAPILDAATVDAVLGSLVGVVARIQVDPARREDRNLIVIDDFLDDAETRRAEALACDYQPVDWFLFPGFFSTRVPGNVPEVMARLGRLLDTRLLWGEGPIHGRYRYASTAHRRRAGANVHVNQFSWNAVLCLTPTALCTGGISFYRHRRTGLFGRDLASLRASGGAEPDFTREVEELSASDGLDESKWEEVHRVDLRMNRLIVFNPRRFHRTNSQFGTSPKDGRVTQGFSCFAADDPYRFESWA